MYKNLVSANTETKENNTTSCLLEHCIGELLNWKTFPYSSKTLQRKKKNSVSLLLVSFDTPRFVEDNSIHSM